MAIDGETTDSRPTLLKDRAFWGINSTQFLGAFNDNLYKQLVLLLAMPSGKDSGDLQGWATFVFSLPFVLFSGYAGYLSDRYAKTFIIVCAKVAEILIMGLGMLAFLYYEKYGMFGTWSVLFLMGIHSTFFGPGKYGVLPELFRAKDLARANGLVLMATFLSIIFGAVFAGRLFDQLVTPVKDQAGEVISVDPTSLWIGSAICIGIAILGTLTSLMIRRTPAAQPSIRLSWDAFGVSKEILGLLKRDRGLFFALMVSSVFWMVASLASPTVNRLGKDMLHLNKESVGVLVGMIAIGIMTGGPFAGWLCRKIPSHLAVRLGLWGIFICLLGLGAYSSVAGNQQTYLGLQGARVVLILLGICAAIFSIPVSVFLQERPPSELKGRMIATMNQANFAGMMLAGPIYQLFEWLANSFHLPICSVFWMIAILILPPALLFRLEKSEKLGGATEG